MRDQNPKPADEMPQPIDEAAAGQPGADGAAAVAAAVQPDGCGDREGEGEEARPQTDQAEHGEVGGPQGPEPTRFGDWERKGRCIDF